MVTNVLLLSVHARSPKLNKTILSWRRRPRRISGVRSEEISPISLRPKISVGDQSQAVDRNIGAEERNSIIGRSSPPALGSAYTFDIRYKSTYDHANADGLSRLPLPEVSSISQSPEASIFNLAQIESLLVTAAQLGRATVKNPVLSKVLRYTKQGWPSDISPELRPFERQRNELTIEFAVGN